MRISIPRLGLCFQGPHHGTFLREDVPGKDFTQSLASGLFRS